MNLCTRNPVLPRIPCASCSAMIFRRKFPFPPTWLCPSRSVFLSWRRPPSPQHSPWDHFLPLGRLLRESSQLFLSFCVRRLVGLEHMQVCRLIPVGLLGSNYFLKQARDQQQSRKLDVCCSPVHARTEQARHTRHLPCFSRARAAAPTAQTGPALHFCSPACQLSENSQQAPQHATSLAAGLRRRGMARLSVLRAPAAQARPNCRQRRRCLSVANDHRDKAKGATRAPGSCPALSRRSAGKTPPAPAHRKHAEC